jgi:hypothetical protein
MMIFQQNTKGTSNKDIYGGFTKRNKIQTQFVKREQ